MYKFDAFIKSKNEEKLLKRKPIIGIMGIAYKPNVDDLRESSALNIVMELLNACFDTIPVLDIDNINIGRKTAMTKGALSLVPKAYEKLFK